MQPLLRIMLRMLLKEVAQRVATHVLGGGGGVGVRVRPSFRVTRLFFDREAVVRAADKGKIKALSRYGAVVRRTAQTSMRYRKGASLPGTPPSAHKSKRLASLKKLGRVKHNGALLREMLFFSYDPSRQSVVVGPVGFKSASGTPVPVLHEFGGSREPYKGEKYLKGKGKSARLIVLKGSVKYPARPFMVPAMKKTLAKFPLAFKGVVSD